MYDEHNYNQPSNFDSFNSPYFDQMLTYNDGRCRYQNYERNQDLVQYSNHEMYPDLGRHEQYTDFEKYQRITLLNNKDQEWKEKTERFIRGTEPIKDWRRCPRFNAPPNRMHPPPRRRYSPSNPPRQIRRRVFFVHDTHRKDFDIYERPYPSSSYRDVKPAKRKKPSHLDDVHRDNYDCDEFENRKSPFAHHAAKKLENNNQHFKLTTNIKDPRRSESNKNQYADRVKDTYNKSPKDKDEINHFSTSIFECEKKDKKEDTMKIVVASKIVQVNNISINMKSSSTQVDEDLHISKEAKSNIATNNQETPTNKIEKFEERTLQIDSDDQTTSIKTPEIKNNTDFSQIHKTTTENSCSGSSSPVTNQTLDLKNMDKKEEPHVLPKNMTQSDQDISPVENTKEKNSTTQPGHAETDSFDICTKLTANIQDAENKLHSVHSKLTEDLKNVDKNNIENVSKPDGLLEISKCISNGEKEDKREEPIHLVDIKKEITLHKDVLSVNKEVNSTGAKSKFTKDPYERNKSKKDDLKVRHLKSDSRHNSKYDKNTKKEDKIHEYKFKKIHSSNKSSSKHRVKNVDKNKGSTLINEPSNQLNESAKSVEKNPKSDLILFHQPKVQTDNEKVEDIFDSIELMPQAMSKTDVDNNENGECVESIQEYLFATQHNQQGQIPLLLTPESHNIIEFDNSKVLYKQKCRIIESDEETVDLSHISVDTIDTRKSYLEKETLDIDHRVVDMDIGSPYTESIILEISETLSKEDTNTSHKNTVPDTEIKSHIQKSDKVQKSVCFPKRKETNTSHKISQKHKEPNIPYTTNMEIGSSRKKETNSSHRSPTESYSKKKEAHISHRSPVYNTETSSEICPKKKVTNSSCSKSLPPRTNKIDKEVHSKKKEVFPHKSPVYKTNIGSNSPKSDKMGKSDAVSKTKSNTSETKKSIKTTQVNQEQKLSGGKRRRQSDEEIKDQKSKLAKLDNNLDDSHEKIVNSESNSVSINKKDYFPTLSEYKIKKKVPERRGSTVTERMNIMFDIDPEDYRQTEQMVHSVSPKIIARRESCDTKKHKQSDKKLPNFKYATINTTDMVIEKFLPLALPTFHNLFKFNRISFATYDCTDEATVLESPEIQDKIDIVKLDDSTDSDDVIEIKDDIPIIDLTDTNNESINETSEVNSCKESKINSVEMEKDDKQDVLNMLTKIHSGETITLYRGEQTLNNLLDVQATSASITTGSNNLQANNSLKTEQKASNTNDAVSNTVESKMAIPNSPELLNSATESSIPDKNTQLTYSGIVAEVINSTEQDVSLPEESTDTTTDKTSSQSSYIMKEADPSTAHDTPQVVLKFVNANNQPQQSVENERDPSCNLNNQQNVQEVVITVPYADLPQESVAQHIPIPHQSIPQQPVQQSRGQRPLRTIQPNVQCTTVQQPTVQQPTVQHSTVQQPTGRNPTVQHSTVQQPTGRHPIIQNPINQQSIFQQSFVQRPVMQEHIVQQTVLQQPIIQESIVQNRTVQHSILQQSLLQQSIIQNTMVHQFAHQQSVQQSSIQRSVVPQAAVHHSMVQQSIVNRPVVLQTAVQQSPRQQLLPNDQGNNSVLNSSMMATSEKVTQNNNNALIGLLQRPPPMQNNRIVTNPQPSMSHQNQTTETPLVGNRSFGNVLHQINTARIDPLQEMANVFIEYLGNYEILKKAGILYENMLKSCKITAMLVKPFKNSQTLQLNMLGEFLVYTLQNKTRTIRVSDFQWFIQYILCTVQAKNPQFTKTWLFLVLKQIMDLQKEYYIANIHLKLFYEYVCMQANQIYHVGYRNKQPTQRVAQLNGDQRVRLHSQIVDYNKILSDQSAAAVSKSVNSQNTSTSRNAVGNIFTDNTTQINNNLNTPSPQSFSNSGYSRNSEQLQSSTHINSVPNIQNSNGTQAFEVARHNVASIHGNMMQTNPINNIAEMSSMVNNVQLPQQSPYMQNIMNYNKLQQQNSLVQNVTNTSSESVNYTPNYLVSHKPQSQLNQNKSCTQEMLLSNKPPVQSSPVSTNILKPSCADIQVSSDNIKQVSPQEKNKPNSPTNKQISVEEQSIDSVVDTRTTSNDLSQDIVLDKPQVPLIKSSPPLKPSRSPVGTPPLEPSKSPVGASALESSKSPVHTPPLEPAKSPVGASPSSEIIDLTWIDDVDPRQIEDELDLVIKDEPVEESEVVLNQEQFPDAPPPTDEIESPFIYEGNYNELLPIERLCICEKPAEYVCGCRMAMYCSGVCQQKHWKVHKSLCLRYTSQKLD